MTLPRPGEIFRRFEILARLGGGGMGEVYRARDTELGRDVALKFLTATDDSPGLGERLRREAKALASLRHPGIVTIYDIDEVDGIPFLVLEWVPGTSLAQRSTVGPCPLPEFFHLAMPIAEALAAAHRQGIVHRDVKPANVLLTGAGEVKLVDFGLAKALGAEQGLTQRGMIVGTVAYMSPEQAAGSEVGPGSDVFSFGVLAYELLAGRRPFAGESFARVLHAILEEDPPSLEALRPDLPADVSSLIQRCLGKGIDDRPSDGTRLVAELERARDGMTQPQSASATAPTKAYPSAVESVPEQQIRFCSTADGVRIAYAMVGQGPPLVRVLGWFTHLELEWQWPELRSLWERLAERFTVVRYDGRGMGLSDPWEEAFDEDKRLLDLDAVLTATGIEAPVLLAISEGEFTSATFAVDSPQRVSHLVFYGCYSRGLVARPGFDPEEDAALMTLMRKGWGRKDPTFRQVFTSQFFPVDADPQLIAHFNELQRASASAETAVRYVRSLHHGRGDARAILERVRTPTLVLHRQRDRTVPFEEGRRIAALIPGAEFKALHGTDHYFPIDRSSAGEVADAIVRFVFDAGR